MNQKEEQATPNVIKKQYGLGKDFGYVELNSDGTVRFVSLIEESGLSPFVDSEAQITRKHIPILRAIIEHLERSGFEDDDAG
ncbi:MAG: hypothetical protein WBQ94_04455 [Terracidiphilus sp.]